MKKRHVRQIAVMALLWGNIFFVAQYLVSRGALAEARATLGCLSQEHAKSAAELVELKILARDIRFLEFSAFANRFKTPTFNRILEATFRYADKYDLNPYLVLAMIYLESGFKPQVISAKGACGLMQINYAVWKDALQLQFERLFAIDYNIENGCRILRLYLDEAGGNLSRALYLYNNGYQENGNSAYPGMVLQGKFAQKIVALAR